MIKTLLPSNHKSTLNIIINNPLVSIQTLLSKNEYDWFDNELKITKFETEKFLPKLLVKYNIFKSISEVRKNRPDLILTLNYNSLKDEGNFFTFSIGSNKKHVITIIIGVSLCQLIDDYKKSIDDENLYYYKCHLMLFDVIYNISSKHFFKSITTFINDNKKLFEYQRT